ncbi:hypothetical protein PTKIN_Ptkin16aG0083900 [Pterospermum kingtungense]
MGSVDLFVVALMPVLKVLLLVFYLLNPALLVTSLAGTITPKSLVTLWFMPVNIIVAYMIGYALGWILIKFTKTPKHLQGIVIGCCSAGNLGNLPFIIVPALCDKPNNPFADSSTCYSDAKAYASLSMAVSSIYTWSYVYYRVSAYATEHNRIKSSEGASESSSASCTEALLTSGYGQIPEDGSRKVELHLTNLRETKEVTFMEKIVQCLKSIRSKIDLKKMFAPSTIASIVGFVIGIISPVTKLLIGDSAPLHVIYSSAALIGDAAIPSKTLIMGANLLKGLKRSEMNVLAILGVVSVRNILFPFFGIGVTKAAHHFGLVGSDSLYQFVLMIQYAVPPALNIGTMAQLFQSGVGETSIILLWTYAVSSISLTLRSTLFMSLLY